MQVVGWKKEPCTLKQYPLPGAIGLTGCSFFASPTTEWWLTSVTYDDGWPLGRLSVPCNYMYSSEHPDYGWCFSCQISQDGICASAWMASSFFLHALRQTRDDHMDWRKWTNCRWKKMEKTDQHSHRFLWMIPSLDWPSQPRNSICLRTSVRVARPREFPLVEIRVNSWGLISD